MEGPPRNNYSKGEITDALSKYVKIIKNQKLDEIEFNDPCDSFF